MHIVIFDFVNEMHRTWSVIPLGNAIRRLSVQRSTSQGWMFAINRIETLNPTSKTQFTVIFLKEFYFRRLGRSAGEGLSSFTLFRSLTKH